jgi:putative SOS response-associated peptidase YedK
MCYDISFTTSMKQLSDYFPDLIHDDQVQINFDEAAHIVGHAYGLHPIIYRNKDTNSLHLKLMEWGCIPYYIKEASSFVRQRTTMLNARSERILDDPKSYWNKIRNRRCLIPVTAFYEHRQVDGLKKKVPYIISVKDEPILLMPGLYSVVKLPDSQGELQEVWTFTLITRKANKVMAQIHNDGENTERMPLLLPIELSKKWVSDNLTEEEYREILNYEMPSENLDFHPVYTIRSSKPRPDGKAKNEFYDWGNIPAIEI